MTGSAAGRACPRGAAGVTSAAVNKGKILLVVQRKGSDPGRVGSALETMGYELDIRVASEGHVLPATMDGHAGAVVFGGPMSANDDSILPYIGIELEWIPRALESGKPFLGICLGCQLLARALGARVAPHPDGLHEIGYFPVSPTDAGRDLFDGPLCVYQWHGDGFELPSGSELLAKGKTFANQAFRYGETAYGVQFHPEVTAAIVERWTTLAAHKLSLAGAQSREEHFSGHRRHEQAMIGWLKRFLERWLAPEPRAGPSVSAAGTTAPGE